MTELELAVVDFLPFDARFVVALEVAMDKSAKSFQG